MDLFLRTTRCVMAAMAVVAAWPAHGQVFKCQDPGGRTVYQQAPCPGSGTSLALDPHRPSAEEQAAAQRRSRQDQAAARQLEAEQARRRQEAGREADQRRTRAQGDRARCDRQLKEAEALERRSRTRSKGTDRERDAGEAEALRERHFSECFAAR